MTQVQAKQISAPHIRKLINQIHETKTMEAVQEQVRTPQKIRFRLATKSSAVDVNVSPRMIVGRSEDGFDVDVDLAPHDAHQMGVSRRHALLTVNGDDICIMDVGSRNGTRVNGKKLEYMEPQVLHEGDLVYFGRFPVTVSFLYKGVLTKLGTQEMKAISQEQPQAQTQPKTDAPRKPSTKMLTGTRTAKKLETIEMKGMLAYIDNSI